MNIAFLARGLKGLNVDWILEVMIYYTHTRIILCGRITNCSDPYDMI